MNRFECIGRLTKDIETQTTSTGVTVARSSIAVDRKFKKEDGTRDTDFFNLVFWRGLANTVAEYCHKGSKLYIAGELQTRTYDKQDGTKGYAMDVVVDDIEFLDNKQSNSDGQPKEDLQPVNDDRLPF